MLVLALAIASTGAFAFKGGSIEDLCATLHAQCGVSVVAEIYDGDQRIGKFKSSSEEASLAKRVKKETGYTLTDVDGMFVLTAGKLNPRLYNPRGNKIAHPGQPAVENGLDPDFSALQFMDAETLKIGTTVDGVSGSDRFTTVARIALAKGLSRRLEFNRTFGQIPLALAVSDLSQKKFLRAVSAAIGAKMYESDKTVALKFDPKPYRSRFLAAAGDPLIPADTSSPRGRIMIARREMAMTFVRDAADSFLIKAFDAPPLNYSGFAVQSGNALFLAVNNFAQADMDVAASAQGLGNSAAVKAMEEFQRIDPDKPKWFSFLPPAQFVVLFPFKGGGSMAQQ